MALSAGRRLGPYEVLAQIGVGGMGEVYRAKDTRLQREVALKVLPDLFAHDSDRLARFQREAQVLASLNHPNIAIIHGLEEADGVRALVLELVGGPTLADRIAQGPIPVDEALPIARQIAEALEAAHGHGITHRDLKPSNIKLRSDGTVKVLDFGLAKLAQTSDIELPGSELSLSPTLTSPAATRMGVILGTAAYMSPEQAKGKPVDRQTDIWAFGCVLYEMLTGKRVFAGDDVSDTLAAVLKSEPDWRALPAETPGPIRKLLRRCIEKDRKRRLANIADARLEIEEAQTTPAGDLLAGPLAPPARASGRIIGLAVAAALGIGAIGAGAAVWLATRPAPPRVTRTTITPSVGAPLTITGTSRDLAIAPDGTRLVYVGANGTRLVVRALDQLQPTAIDGVGSPSHPIFSPDGQWIAFFDGNTALKKVAAAGGPAVAVSPLIGSPRGASWAPNDTIVFATTDASTGLLRVGAAGGKPEALTTPDRAQGELDHVWPELLPGGEAALFTITTPGGIEQAQLAVVDLRTGVRRVLLRGGSHAQYVAPGYLVYGVATTLRAVAFDLERMAVIGAPVPVIEGVAMTALGGTDVSVADDGTLVYVPGVAAAAVRVTLVWVDRQGREEPLAAPPRAYSNPRLSPDGTKLAVSVQGQEADVWIWDLGRQTLARFTFGGAAGALWTSDGQRLVWSSGGSLYRQAAGGGAAELLAKATGTGALYSVAPDGTRMVLRADRSGTGVDLVVLALDGERQITPLIQTAANERNAEFSPDGRWLAYESDESGQSEIYVRPFPAVDAGRWQVSTAGGRKPLGARSGREIFYLALDGALLGVPVETAGEASFRVGTPARLVEGRYFGGGPFGNRQYDVSPDGKRFLMLKDSSGADGTALPQSIVVVQHWVEELKRLVPTN